MFTYYRIETTMSYYGPNYSKILTQLGRLALPSTPLSNLLPTRKVGSLLVLSRIKLRLNLNMTRYNILEIHPVNGREKKKEKKQNKNKIK